MSSPQEASRFSEVADRVSNALRSNHRHDLKFAAKMALDAFDSEGRIIYLSMYAECKFHLDPQDGYQEFRRLIQTYKLRPDPQDMDAVVFFARYAAMLALQSPSFDKDRDLKADALEIATALLPAFEASDVKEQLLLVLFENRQFELTEDLAESIYVSHPETARRYLLGLAVVEGNLLGAYNYFCDLAALKNHGQAPEINSAQDVLEWLEKVFSKYAPIDEPNLKNFSLNDGAKPPEDKTTLPLLMVCATKLGSFVFRMLKGSQRKQPGETEMDIEQLQKAWFSHFSHFDYLSPSGGETSPEKKDFKLSGFDTDTGDIVLEAF